jgi:Aldo/keto reductase family
VSYRALKVQCNLHDEAIKEATVEYRQVGNTELRVSEIGFGCGGNAGLMVRGSPAEQRRVVERAVELGINYFDNAPDYGNGIAEENLGRIGILNALFSPRHRAPPPSLARASAARQPCRPPDGGGLALRACPVLDDGQRPLL